MIFSESIPDKFYIYGTGQYARIFVSWLQAKKLKGRACGCIVSERDAGQGDFCGLPVFAFDDISEKLNGVTVFIAIAVENAVGIAEKLEAVGAQDVNITYALLDEMEGDLFDKFSADGKALDQVVVWNYWGMGYYDQC